MVNIISNHKNTKHSSDKLFTAQHMLMFEWGYVLIISFSIKKNNAQKHLPKWYTVNPVLRGPIETKKKCHYKTGDLLK